MRALAEIMPSAVQKHDLRLQRDALLQYDDNDVIIWCLSLLQSITLGPAALALALENLERIAISQERHHSDQWHWLLGFGFAP